MDVYKETSKNGVSKVIYIEKIINDRKVKKYIHSSYNPLKEAVEWVNKNYNEEKKVYIIYGGGLLYHVDELLRTLDNDGKVIIIEPIKDIFNIIKNEPLFKKLKNDSRFHMIVTSSNFDMLNYIKSIIKFTELKDIAICKLESYENIFFDEYKEYVISLKKTILHMQADRDTKYVFSHAFADNVLNNLFIAQQSHDINKFKGIFKNKIAIIVSAGPSLNKNIHLLKGNEDKFIIITGGRTLKTLLDKGITPHFVVSIDASVENYNLFSKVLSCNVPLVTCFVNNKEILRNYSGEKIFFNDSFLSGLDMQILKKNIDFLSGGGSVATFQLGFAEYIGCKTIIMIGQDLAYTENKFHADIAADPHNKVDIDDNLIRIKGVNSEYVYTSKVLNIYKDWFENYSYLKQNLVLINSTEGGAYIQGFEHMTLAQAIYQYSNISEDFYGIINSILKRNKERINYKEFENNIKCMLNDTQKIIKLTRKASNVSQKLRLNKNNKFEIGQLDIIDKKIRQITSKTKLADILMQIELSEFESLKSNDENEIINTNKMFYNTLYETYIKFESIIIEALDLYNKKNS